MVSTLNHLKEAFRKEPVNSKLCIIDRETTSSSKSFRFYNIRLAMSVVILDGDISIYIMMELLVNMLSI